MNFAVMRAPLAGINYALIDVSLIQLSTLASRHVAEVNRDFQVPLLVNIALFAGV
jgi:hypothetical protein